MTAQNLSNDDMQSITPQGWDITTITMADIEQRDYTVAVIPTGAIEPHNRHLPHGQDFGHATWVSRRCCADAHHRGGKILWLPGLPYGVDCNQMHYRMPIHVSQATLDVMLRDIIASLVHHGIDRVVLLNGHGGNDFTPLIRQIQCDMKVFVFNCNWWTVGFDRYETIFDAPDDHGGEMETSVALALWPQLVQMDQAGSGQALPFRFEALNKGYVRTSRDFGVASDCCGVGDPSKATAEKGRAYLELICQRITDFLVELSQSPMDDHFPFERA